MAAPVVRLRRSATQSAVPTTAQLALGEVAINTFDGKLFIKKDNGTESIVEIGAGGGGGGISNVVEDTTPQLGGDLDLNGNDITGTGNATISTSAGVLSLTASGVGGKVNISGVAGNEIGSGTGALQAGIFSGKEASAYTQNGSDLTVRGGNAFDALANTNTVQGGHLYLTGGVAGGGGEGVGVANGGSVYIDGGPLAGTGSNGNVLIGTTRTTFVGIGTSNPDVLSPLKIAQTWDASTDVVTGITLDVTDTSSASTSKLLDLKVGGTSKFDIDKSGNIRLSEGSGSNLAFRFNQLYLGSSVDGLNVQTNKNFTTLIKGSKAYGWSATENSYTSAGLTLFRDADGILAQRGTTGNNQDTTNLQQIFRIYNTWTNSTDDFERGQIGWSTNTLIVGTEKGGVGGTARPLHLQTDGTTRVAVTTDGFVGIGVTEPTEELEVSGDIKATSFIKSGGTASQYLMADGSVTSTTVEHKILDDISGSFNGSTTSFTLSSSSTNFINSEITSAARLMISVGGVVQQPDPTQTSGFYISGGTNISTDPIVINFVEAPKAGQDFFGVAYGLSISPSDAFVTEEQSIVNSIVFGV